MAAVTINENDGVKFTGQTNNLTVGPFVLQGGKYFLSSTSSGTNSVQLNVLGPDGSTYIACGAAQTNNYGVYDLPPGTYQIVCGAAYTTGQGTLTKIPYLPSYV